MSIMRSIQTGLSGLQANGRAMGIVGDNIANANTTGFKGGRAQFADLMAQSTLGLGSGVVSMGAQQLFGQGDLEVTGQALDLAVNGPGFFMVRGQSAGREGTFYSRAGQFGFDPEGFVTSNGDMRLQGWMADGDGNVRQGTPTDLELGGTRLPPRPTSAITLNTNLDANAEISPPWDPANPADTSAYSTSVTVYDAQGKPIQADIYYTKTADNAWEYHVMVDGGELDMGTPGVPTEITSGALTFDGDGKLTNHTQGAVNFSPQGASAPQDIAINLEGSSQYAGEFSLRALEQDGFKPGELRDLRVEQDGRIVGSFSNGEEQVLAQVALANFQAPQGLERLGGNLWRATVHAGEPIVGAPGTGNLGGVVGGALESSNVDLAHEFVKMIAFQRGFQASSKTVTTGDQMLTEVINLKR